MQSGETGSESRPVWTLSRKEFQCTAIDGSATASLFALSLAFLISSRFCSVGSQLRCQLSSDFGHRGQSLLQTRVARFMIGQHLNHHENTMVSGQTVEL